MGVNGKIVKCAKSWKQLIIERNCWNIGPRGARNCVCKVPLNSVWCHSVHFAKFPMLIFSQASIPQFSSNFNQTLWKVWYGDGNLKTLFLLFFVIMCYQRVFNKLFYHIRCQMLNLKTICQDWMNRGFACVCKLSNFINSNWKTTVPLKWSFLTSPWRRINRLYRTLFFFNFLAASFVYC